MKQQINYIFSFLLLFGMSQAAFTQCSETSHSNNPNDGWKSCGTSPNPNPARGDGHWIQYDFGFLYKIGTTHIWNANEIGNTGIGLKDVVIDYSENGTDWTELGTFTFDEATGLNDYEGFEGPDFENASVRYVIITALSVWDNGNCTGLAEARFNISGPVNDSEVIQPDGILTLFPNPVEKVLTIQIENFDAQEIIIQNVAGHEVLRSNFQQSGQMIDVSRLMAGFYSVTILDGENVGVTEKFVKME